MRKTVQERNQRAADEEAAKEAAEQHEAAEDLTDGAKARTLSSASSTSAGGDAEPSLSMAEPLALAGTKLNSLFTSIGGYTLETSFGSLNLGDVGSKLLHSADELLGSLAGEHAAGGGDDTSDADVLAARRFRLLALQEDPETYTEPPMDAETFLKWKAATPSAELEAVKTEVLEHYPAVVDKFSELVPSVVDADAFWTHYIYKASLLAAQEQRGADLLEHALNDSEEEIGWDADSPRNDDGERKRSAAAFFPEEESKEDDDGGAAKVKAEAEAEAEAPKPDSSSSDGESWIELDERKDPQAPLSTSSAASSVQEAKAAAAVAAAAKPTAAAAAPVGGDSTSVVDEEEELDWGDDDIIPEDALSGDEASATTTAPAFHEEPKKRAGDWGDWD